MEKKFRIRDWILELPQKGRTTFSTNEIFTQYPMLKRGALKSVLNRLVANGKIQSVWHGFYVVVPVEYELRGIVPPVVYIDQLIKYLQKDYYVGLLNAAAFYGAAHQQPQEFTIITNGKNLRSKQKNGVKINCVYKKDIPHAFIIQNTTKTGYVSVSSPELTAFDLLLYQKVVGGLSRVGTVLNELVEEMDFDKITSDFLRQFPVPVIQRFGYLLDEVLDYRERAEILIRKINQADIKFRKTLLKPEIQTNDFSNQEYNEIWKIIINEEIEIDE